MANNSLPAPVSMAEGGKTTNGKRWLASLVRNGDANVPPTTSFRRPAKPNEHSHTESSTSSKSSPGPIIIDIEDVVGDLAIYQLFRLPSLAPGVEVTDLPNFDDVTLHGVPEQVQEDLWDLEARRLVKAVTQKESPRFEGTTDLAIDSKRGYATLANLANRMLQSLSVVCYDREKLLREHHRPSFSRDKFNDSKEVLQHLLDKEDDNDAGERQVEDAHAAKGSFGDLFTFVDYCTAVLARYLCSAVEGNSVHINILAHMAKLSTKIKVVSADLRESARRSLGYGLSREMVADRVLKSLLDRDGMDDDRYEPHIRTRATFKHPSRGKSRYSDSGPHERPSTVSGVPDRPWTAQRSRTSELETETKKRRLRILYYEKCENYQQNLSELLEGLVGHFRDTRLTQIFSTSYEICGMVYETGFERFRTLVFQDEEHNFAGSSDTHIVNYARSAFHLLNQAVNDLQHHMRDATIKPSISSLHKDEPESVGTMISWKYTPDVPGMSSESLSEHARIPFELRSMSNVITVLVPLLLVNPSIVVSVSAFYGRIAFNKHMRRHSRLTNENVQVSFKPIVYGKYTGYCSVSTREYRNQQQKIRSSDGPRSLSSALMRNNYLYAGDHASPYSRVKTTTFSSDGISASGGTPASPMPEKSSLEQIVARREELDRVGRKMQSWVFEERGVMVRCKTYVASTMLFCTLLAVAGLAVGVTLGPRIDGVDPFNITTYCWVLAAFVMLVAKSVRVHEWPWNDFLHWRVLCRSVSELSSVTGIDEQLILAKLLQDESNSILDTRGPFNVVFRGGEGGDGFSIDRPIGMWAMLLSGLIMVEVESIHGRRLVCLDLRRGTRLEVIESQTIEYYECLYSKKGEIPDRREGEELGEERHGASKKVHLVRGELTWTRALGLYSNKEALFV